MNLLKEIESCIDVPSQQGWRTLCTLLEDEQHCDWQAAMALAENGLASWPVRDPRYNGWPVLFRRVPDRWAKALLKRKKVPAAWSLARFLQYHEIRITEKQFGALIVSPLLAKITHLYFYGNGLGPEAIPELIASPTLKSVTFLVLSARTGGGVSRLVNSNLANQLEGLELSHQLLSVQDIEAIATTDKLSNLKSLSLDQTGTMVGGVKLEDAHIKAIANAKGLPALEVLELGLYAEEAYAHLEKCGSAHMRRAGYAGQLKPLSVAELKKRCRAEGIKGHAKLKHPELVKLLLERWDDTKANR